MKARRQLPVEIRKQIKLESERYWREIEPVKRVEMAQRCLKVFLYVLNRDYGFGQKRLKAFYKKCGEFLAKADDDEVFWERIDRVIIDGYGFDELGRDFTERGKAVRVYEQHKEDKKNEN